MPAVTLLEGLGIAEGPVALPGGGIACCSITEGAVFVLADDGTPARRVETGGGANGLTADADGVLFVAQNGGIFGGRPAPAGIQRIDLDGSVEYLLVDLDAPNDLCFGPDGLLYFTDSRGESDPHDPSTAEPGRLFRCDPSGGDLELLVEGPAFINGLGFDRSGTALIVAETSRHRLLRYDWGPQGLGRPEVFCELVAGCPDGFAIDADDCVWVAAVFDSSIHVYGPDGDLRERHQLDPAHIPSNCCLVERDAARIYVTTGGAGALLTWEVATRPLPLYPFRASQEQPG